MSIYHVNLVHRMTSACRVVHDVHNPARGTLQLWHTTIIKTMWPSSPRQTTQLLRRNHFTERKQITKPCGLHHHMTALIACSYFLDVVKGYPAGHAQHMTPRPNLHHGHPDMSHWKWYYCPEASSSALFNRKDYHSELSSP